LANNILYTRKYPAKDHIAKRDDYGDDNGRKTAIDLKILDELVGYKEQKRIDDDQE